MTERRTRRIVIVDDDGRPLKASPCPQRSAEDDRLDHLGEDIPRFWDSTVPAPSGRRIAPP